MTYDVRYRTAENYVARARERILQETGKPKAEHVADSYEFYRMMQVDADKDIDKIKARERIDKLLGLETPQRYEHSGPGESPIEVRDVTQVTRQLLQEPQYLQNS